MIDGRTPDEIARDDARSGGFVRFRAMDTSLGRWTRQDPAEFVDGANLFLYQLSAPTVWLDSTGLAADCPPGYESLPDPAYEGPVPNGCGTEDRKFADAPGGV